MKEKGSVVEKFKSVGKKLPDCQWRRLDCEVEPNTRFLHIQALLADFSYWEVMLRKDLVINGTRWDKNESMLTEQQTTVRAKTFIYIAGSVTTNTYWICVKTEQEMYGYSAIIESPHTKNQVERFLEEYALSPDEQPTTDTATEDMLPEGRHEPFRDPPNR